MTQTIYDKIELKGQKQVKTILSEAQVKADKIYNDLVSQATSDAEIRILNAQSAANKNILYKERLLDLEIRQALLISKQNIITRIFDGVLKKLEQLQDSELLNYVEKLIKSEEVIGDEVMHTNAIEYDKYLKALSTNKKGDLVELDLLNKKLNTNFRLSSKSMDLRNGFILEGKFFDLNFSLNQIIDNLRDKNEKAIAAELFE